MESVNSSLKMKDIAIIKQEINDIISTSGKGCEQVLFVPIDLIKSLIENNKYKIWSATQVDIKFSCSLITLAKVINDEGKSRCPQLNEVSLLIENLVQESLLPELVSKIFLSISCDSYKELKSIMNMVSCSKKWNLFVKNNFAPPCKIMEDKRADFRLCETDMSQVFSEEGLLFYLLELRETNVFDINEPILMIEKDEISGEDLRSFSPTLLEIAISCKYINLVQHFIDDNYNFYYAMRNNVNSINRVLKKIKGNFNDESYCLMALALIKNGGDIDKISKCQLTILIKAILKLQDVSLNYILKELINRIENSELKWLDLIGRSNPEMALEIINKLPFDLEDKQYLIDQLIN